MHPWQVSFGLSLATVLPLAYLVLQDACLQVRDVFAAAIAAAASSCLLEGRCS